MSTPIRPLSGMDFPAPAAFPDERVDRLLPEAEDRSKLEGAAETVGATLGRAVNTVRSIPRKFTVIKGGATDKASGAMEQASAKLDDIKSQAMNQAEVIGNQVKDRAGALGGQVRDGAQAVGHEVRVRAEWVGRQVRDRALLTRNQARHVVHEYPLQCLGAVFGAAFLTGITLRIWRTRD